MMLRHGVKSLSNISNIAGINLITSHHLANVSQLRFTSNGNQSDSAVECKEEIKSENRLKLEREIELMRKQGRCLPQRITENQLSFMENLNSKSALRKNINFLLKNEHLKEEQRESKRNKNLIVDESKQKYLENRSKNEHINYGLNYCSLLPSLRKRSVVRWRHQKVLEAMQFGPKLVFDCSYDAYMTPFEARNAGKQLGYCINVNRKHRAPFDLHFCNVNCNSISIKSLHQNISDLGKLSVTCHEEDMIDVFPRERLVFLSPNAETELDTFDGNDIYIIGSLVDKKAGYPLSLARSKEMGLRTAKLPFEKYFVYDGSKRLTLVAVNKILLDIRLTGDWKYSLRHLPPSRVIAEKN